ncbi:MAG: alanine--tRNA ligase, partial [Oscillospiraceae bacterium]|nr:alanine--tRNA ligase [Oscillospiraceae bacterium]
FSQFNNDGEGNYTELSQKNIDTGMGLERLACVMQGVDNLFEVDTVQRIMKHIGSIAGVEYKKDEKVDVSLRVITDHVRSTTMMVGDGVLPSNEGRGYVLRRLLRRPARHGRLLGITEPFLYKVVDTVIEENKIAYPNLVDSRDYIVKVVKTEEERFAKTIDSGMELLNNIIDKIEAAQTEEKLLSGDIAFKLYDTFGFPIDLTREILSEKKIDIDESEFVKLMNEQRDRARKAREECIGDVSWEGDVLAELESKTEFVGYGATDVKANLVAIVCANELHDSISEGEKAAIVLDKTPFYAESGGQVGDMGIISDGKNIFKVLDCKKSPTGQFLHIGEMTSGTLNAGNAVTAAVALPRRQAIMKNHTAAHLLQYALREVLGNHVHQAGQLVDPDFCRFDFTHFSGVSAEELKKVEALVNEMIFSCLPVTVSQMSQNEAKEKGAMALFSEKYGDVVRVVDVSGRSVELCGGTHVDNTAKIGMFKIIKESSVAAGVRRIEAVTGAGVLEYLEQLHSQLASAAEALKIGNLNDVPAKINALQAELKAKDREIDSMSQKMAAAEIKGLFSNAKEVSGVKIITAAFNDSTPDALRALGDKVKENEEAIVAVFSTVTGPKASILAVATKAAIAKGVHSGNLIKQLTALVGGRGGGKPDSAMGGTENVFEVDKAIAKVDELVSGMIK